MATSVADREPQVMARPQVNIVNPTVELASSMPAASNRHVSRVIAPANIKLWVKIAYHGLAALLAGQYPLDRSPATRNTMATRTLMTTPFLKPIICKL